MRNYDKGLADAMAASRPILREKGLDIELRPIPDDDAPGRVDSREIQWMAGRRAFDEAYAKERPAVPALVRIREKMGTPNQNLNTVELITRFEEHDFGGNRVAFWIYTPRKPYGDQKRPGFLYLHGGGWVGGTPFIVENACRLLAELGGCVVLNIDYSLAPEKPFPNALEDCMASLRHIHDNASSYGVDPAKLAIGGDSAGGNLAAACALLDRDGGGLLRYQALIYPVVTALTDNRPLFDWDISAFARCEEHRQLIERDLVTVAKPVPNRSSGESMYLQHGEDPRDPRISPLYAASHQGLCKALIAVAEFDGLRIQGEAYGRLLREAGTDVRVLRYLGVGHAFLDKIGHLVQAEDCIREVAADVRCL